jgi:hypothetical protein
MHLAKTLIYKNNPRSPITTPTALNEVAITTPWAASLVAVVEFPEAVADVDPDAVVVLEPLPEAVRVLAAEDPLEAPLPVDVEEPAVALALALARPLPFNS